LVGRLQTLIEPLPYFLIALKASLFSTGGTGNLPSLRQDLVARGWATDQEFASAIAIGQVAPGPTGLWVVALGYLTAGIAGAFLMVVAVALPPLLVIPVAHVHARIGHLAIVRGFARGVTVGVAGAVPAIFLFRVGGAYGYSVMSIVLFGGCLIALLTKRWPPLVVLIAAAVAGIVLFRR